MDLLVGLYQYVLAAMILTVVTTAYPTLAPTCIPTPKDVPDSSRIYFVLPDDDYDWLRFALVAFSNAKSFFDIKSIGASRRIAGIDKVDVFTWKEWRALNKAVEAQRVDYHAVVPPTFVYNSDNILNMFNNKVEWLQFMRNAGLSAHVPTVYSDTCDIYPCILKNSKMHWGKGVHVVHNESHLQRVIAETVQGNQPFHLEEGLNGWGLSEASAFGSVYKSKIMSLRCITVIHSKEKVQRWNPHAKKDEKELLYVRGYQLSSSDMRHVPCGRDVLEVMSHMFAALDTPYTGAFCADFKGNSKKKPKFMEINARACGSHTSNAELFISTYLPLAFAIREDLLAKRIVTFVPEWYTNQKFLSVLKAEKRNLRHLKLSKRVFRLYRIQKPGTWHQNVSRAAVHL